MKKIILTSFISSCIMLNAFSQDPVSANNKTMTVAEANRLNGVAQPTINGKPYSQYKAEQDALKNQPAVKNVAVSNNVSSIDAPAKQASPIVTEQPVTKSQPAETVKPEVPEQFKMVEAKPWNNSAVADKKANNVTTVPAALQLKGSDPAQSTDPNVVRPVDPNANRQYEAGKSGRSVEEIRRSELKAQPVEVKTTDKNKQPETNKLPVRPDINKEPAPSTHNSTEASKTKAD